MGIVGGLILEAEMLRMQIGLAQLVKTKAQFQAVGNRIMN